MQNKGGNRSEIASLLAGDGGLTVVVVVAGDAEMVKSRG